jgi:hypothetical protein
MKSIDRQEIKKVYEYKDGNLVYRIRTSNRINVGDVAGSINKYIGYVEMYFNKNKVKAHRLIWIYHNGDIPDKLVIDHINGIRHDNRIENLRLATTTQNSYNRSKSIKSTSGYKGVYWNIKAEKWESKIQIDGILKHLGLFITKELAYEAYCKAAKQVQGDYAHQTTKL